MLRRRAAAGARRRGLRDDAAATGRSHSAERHRRRDAHSCQEADERRADPGLHRARRRQPGPQRLHHPGSRRGSGRGAARRRGSGHHQAARRSARRAAGREGQHARGRLAQHGGDAGAAWVRAEGKRADGSEAVDAGAVILGKTNMHELAFGISGYNEGFFTGEQIGTRNPYDRTRFAGGSSSGTGAAIGARLAPGGLGSDTGGSVRIPAALSGGAGLRPTIGRYSQDGVTPISHSRDTVGPMGQTVHDVALLDAVITGSRPPAPAPLAAVRLGVYRAYFLKDLDTDTRAVTEAAFEKLRRVGVTIVDVDMPDLQKANDAASFPVALYEAYDDLKTYLARYQTGVTMEQLAAQIASKDVKGTYDGLVIPRKLPAPNGVVDAAPIYTKAMSEARPALLKVFTDTFQRYGIDALIAPTTPAVAATQGPEASSLPTFLLFIRNTDSGGTAGIPGLTLPAGLGSSTGLPVGNSLDGPRGRDQRLLAIGIAIERVLGRTPPPGR